MHSSNCMKSVTLPLILTILPLIHIINHTFKMNSSYSYSKLQTGYGSHRKNPPIPHPPRSNNFLDISERKMTQSFKKDLKESKDFRDMNDKENNDLSVSIARRLLSGSRCSIDSKKSRESLHSVVDCERVWTQMHKCKDLVKEQIGQIQQFLEALPKSAIQLESEVMLREFKKLKEFRRLLQIDLKIILNIKENDSHFLNSEEKSNVFVCQEHQTQIRNLKGKCDRLGRSLQNLKNENANLIQSLQQLKMQNTSPDLIQSSTQIQIDVIPDKFEQVKKLVFSLFNVSIHNMNLTAQLIHRINSDSNMVNIHQELRAIQKSMRKHKHAKKEEEQQFFNELWKKLNQLIKLFHTLNDYDIGKPTDMRFN